MLNVCSAGTPLPQSPSKTDSVRGTRVAAIIAVILLLLGAGVGIGLGVYFGVYGNYSTN